MDPISFILVDDKPIPIEKRLSWIDGKMVNGGNSEGCKDEIGDWSVCQGDTGGRDNES